MARLIPATYPSNWISAVAALSGVLRALDVPTTTVAVSALSGHAFRFALIATLDGQIGAGGPNHFSSGSALPLYEQLGWRFAAIEAAAADASLSRVREQALRSMRNAIDHGRPSIAYGLHLPEFGIVRGYQGDDLIGATTMSPQYGERIPVSQWPVPGRPSPIRVFTPVKRVRVDHHRAVRAMLDFATGYARLGEPLQSQDHAMDAEAEPVANGLAAYARWSRLLDGDQPISPHGQAYCIQSLQSARSDAAAFLRDEAQRRPVAGLAEAGRSYAAVVLSLSQLATLFPFPSGGNVTSPANRRIGALAVRAAQRHEEEAVDAMAHALRSW